MNAMIEHWAMMSMLEELKKNEKITREQYEKIKEKLLQEYYKAVAELS